ncbi:hypothetical protein ACHAWF_018461 [Thalassiosira exigua]
MGLAPAPSSPPACFLAPAPRFPRLIRHHSTQSHAGVLPPVMSRPSLLRLEASPLESMDVPLGPPLVVLAAVVLAFSAQSWINSLLGGDQGLGAFLSDGAGFNKSGFKPRRRPITDERVVPGDGPLSGPDPLPWLKLPELDYVDVAGQPKKPNLPTPLSEPPPPSVERDEGVILAKLERLRGRMKIEVERGNFEDAKRIENELKRAMEEEGYDFSA